jgi:ferredoxin
MPYVITSPCLGEQYAQCVDVCPVDCIFPGEYKGKSFMVIDPELCINCHACFEVCPVQAIVETEDEDPKFAKINAELAPVFKDNPQVTLRDSDEPPHNLPS